MIGIELVRDRETKERATDERDTIVDRMFAKGVLVLGAGRNAIRLWPPLVLTKDQADACIKALDEAIGEVERDRGLRREADDARSAPGTLEAPQGLLARALLVARVVVGVHVGDRERPHAADLEDRLAFHRAVVARLLRHEHVVAQR